MPRYLILHASVGSGHHSAARALASALARIPGSEVQVEDALDYANPIFSAAYARAYLELSQRAPVVWHMFYESMDITDPDWVAIRDQLRGLAAELVITKLKARIRRYAPDAIICTHFLPAELMVRVKLTGAIRTPTYTVITDHAVHSQWITPGVDGYFVASEFPRRLMIDRGVPSAIIHATGIPVNPEIAAPKDPEAVRRMRDLPPGERILSLFGGGLIPQRVRRMVEGLIALPIPGLLIVIAGRNSELVEALSDLAGGEHMQLRVLAQIDYVDDLVTVSDLVITKAGGLIVSEVLARGTPLIVIDPIPGQEEWNADYLVSSGAGLQLRVVEWVPWTIEQLLSDPARLAAMRMHAQNVGQPYAARNIASEIASQLRSGEHR
jgi:processive 1,2-diacylglycerol beta-glucosyltransferase